ncbi:hypothetical protein [Streptomyces sp. NBC_01483]|uniref:hypothetical protein n=1 Tax=Streptomyces sp. NBC_01483 TaxID=2903883 RepID=UPI002E32C9A7|nr:hypothetical protein [Streptomyces sp. NBC_01483]
MITHWWLHQMPPVSGILRAVLYTGLLVICLAQQPTPLFAPKIIAKTEPTFYTPVFALRALGIRWVRPEVLVVVRNLTVIAWIAAAAGLLQPATAILTFLGFAFLHAVNAGALGANHSSHAALYTLFAMCFSVSYGFSLDGLLAEHTGWPLLLARDSALTSGFAPTLLLVALAYTLFAAGVAKLRFGWPGWRNGAALHFYLRISKSVARWPWLSRLMIANPRLCRLAAWGTLLVELSALVAIFSWQLRMPLVLAWIAMHLVILCVMFPAYYIQMWCYLPLFDWPWLIGKVTGDRPSPHAFIDDGTAATALAAVGCAVSAVLLYVLAVSSEQWPFTSVPMYSNGTAEADRIPLPTRAELHARATKAARGRHTAWGRAWVDEEYLEDIWVRPADSDAEPQRMFHLLMEEGTTTFVRWSQYAKVVRELAIEDVLAKPPSSPEHSEDRLYPATAFLRRVAPLFRAALPTWEKYDALELVCRTSSGGVMIGRAELAESRVAR